MQLDDFVGPVCACAWIGSTVLVGQGPVLHFFDAPSARRLHSCIVLRGSNIHQIRTTEFGLSETIVTLSGGTKLAVLMVRFHSRTPRRPLSTISLPTLYADPIQCSSSSPIVNVTLLCELQLGDWILDAAIISPTSALHRRIASLVGGPLADPRAEPTPAIDTISALTIFLLAGFSHNRVELYSLRACELGSKKDPGDAAAPAMMAQLEQAVTSEEQCSVFCMSFLIPERDEDIPLYVACGTVRNVILLQAPFERAAASRVLCRLSGHEGAIFRLRWKERGWVPGSRPGDSGDHNSSHDETREGATGVRWLCSAAEDRTFRLWRIELDDGSSLGSAATVPSGRCVLSSYGHAGRLWDAHVAGPFVVTTSQDATCRVWCRHTGRCLAVLRGHSGKHVWCAAIDPTCAWLATGGNDGAVKLWPLAKVSTSQGGGGEDGKEPSRLSASASAHVASSPGSATRPAASSWALAGPPPDPAQPLVSLIPARRAHNKGPILRQGSILASAEGTLRSQDLVGDAVAAAPIARAEFVKTVAIFRRGPPSHGPDAPTLAVGTNWGLIVAVHLGGTSPAPPSLTAKTFAVSAKSSPAINTKWELLHFDPAAPVVSLAAARAPLCRASSGPALLVGSAFGHLTALFWGLERTGSLAEIPAAPHAIKWAAHRGAVHLVAWVSPRVLEDTGAPPASAIVLSAGPEGDLRMWLLTALNSPPTQGTEGRVAPPQPPRLVCIFAAGGTSKDLVSSCCVASRVATRDGGRTAVVLCGDIRGSIYVFPLPLAALAAAAVAAATPSVPGLATAVAEAEPVVVRALAVVTRAHANSVVASVWHPFSADADEADAGDDGVSSKEIPTVPPDTYDSNLFETFGGNSCKHLYRLIVSGAAAVPACASPGLAVAASAELVLEAVHMDKHLGTLVASVRAPHSGDELIMGFRTVHFVAWNLSQNLEVCACETPGYRQAHDLEIDRRRGVLTLACGHGNRVTVTAVRLWAPTPPQAPPPQPVQRRKALEDGDSSETSSDDSGEACMDDAGSTGRAGTSTNDTLLGAREVSLLPSHHGIEALAGAFLRLPTGAYAARRRGARLLVTGGEDTLVRVILADRAHGPPRVLGTLEGHTSSIRTITVLGDVAAMAAVDTTRSTGMAAAPITVHGEDEQAGGDEVAALRHLIVTAGGGEQLRVWEVGARISEKGDDVDGPALSRLVSALPLPSKRAAEYRFMSCAALPLRAADFDNAPTASPFPTTPTLSSPLLPWPLHLLAVGTSGAAVKLFVFDPIEAWFTPLAVLAAPCTGPILSLQWIIIDDDSVYGDSGRDDGTSAPDGSSASSAGHTSRGCTPACRRRFLLLAGSTSGEVCLWDTTALVRRATLWHRPVPLDATTSPPASVPPTYSPFSPAAASFSSPATASGAIPTQNPGPPPPGAWSAVPTLARPVARWRMHQCGVNCMAAVAVADDGGSGGGDMGTTVLLVTGGDDQQLAAVLLGLAARRRRPGDRPSGKGTAHGRCGIAGGECAVEVWEHGRGRIELAHASSLKGLAFVPVRPRLVRIPSAKALSAQPALATCHLVTLGCDEALRCWRLTVAPRLLGHTPALLSSGDVSVPAPAMSSARALVDRPPPPPFLCDRDGCRITMELVAETPVEVHELGCLCVAADDDNRAGKTERVEYTTKAIVGAVGQGLELFSFPTSIFI